MKLALCKCTKHFKSFYLMIQRRNQFFINVIEKDKSGIQMMLWKLASEELRLDGWVSKTVEVILLVELSFS